MITIDKVISLFAPHLCLGCGRAGSILCESCLQAAGEPPAPRCVGCKALSDGFKTCESCRSWIDVYAVYVATEYAGIYEALLRAYKFGLKRQAAEPLAAIMSLLPVAVEGSAITIVPIPTAPARVRQRGFDHGALLTRRYYTILKKRARIKAVEIEFKRLLGRRSNSRQLGSSRAQRIRQVANEFFVKDRRHVVGKTILLLDDVTTTGASLAAAAKTLKAAGAKRVYAIVYAQKV